MVKRLRRAYLKPPRHTRADAMTFIATQSLRSIVFGVTEPDAKRRRRLSRANETTGLMADTAGRDILLA
jgi:hypothetical protein